MQSLGSPLANIRFFFRKVLVIREGIAEILHTGPVISNYFLFHFPTIFKINPIRKKSKRKTLKFQKHNVIVRKEFLSKTLKVFQSWIFHGNCDKMQSDKVGKDRVSVQKCVV